MSISPNRIMYLDEVRSLAIMLVVIGHVSRLFSYDFYSWLFCSGVFSLTRIGVPLFFTVSGSLLLTRKYEVKKFLEKRFKRVFLPFFFWIIVYIVAGILIWHYQRLSAYSSCRQFHTRGRNERSRIPNSHYIYSINTVHSRIFRISSNEIQL